MSQHDFTIANQTASAARSDINNALQALASNNSGSGAPSTTYANMLWYETDTNRLKMRNEANTAWLDLGYIDQTDGLEILDNTKVVNTSGTQAGLLGDQTTATWTTGTGTTESLVSPAKVKAAVLEEKVITETTGSAPYYGCRAFVFIEDGSNAATTWTGQNIASVVRNGTGLYTVTFTTDMPNANYSVATGPNCQNSPNNGYAMAIGYTAKSASSFTVRTRRVTDHDVFDCDQMSFSIFA